MSDLVVRFKPNPVNAWLLRLFAIPFADVDGTVVQASWTLDTTVRVSPGRHRVRTFVRYRHLIPGDLGSGSLVVDVPSGADVHIVSSNGVANHTPFVPHVVP